MRPFVLASLAMVAAPGIAAAQTPPAPPPPMTAAEQTREAALARADRMFDRIDTDRDGRITAAERAAMPGPRRGMAPPPPPAAGAPVPPPPAEGRRGPGGGMRMFERADADGDGIITRAEYRAQAAANFDRRDLNRDGRIDDAERQKWRDQRAERRGDD